GIFEAHVVNSAVEFDSRANLVARVKCPEVTAIAQGGTGSRNCGVDTSVVLTVQVNEADFGVTELDVAVDVPAAVFFVAGEAVPVGGYSFAAAFDDVVSTGDT